VGENVRFAGVGLPRLSWATLAIFIFGRLVRDQGGLDVRHGEALTVPTLEARGNQSLENNSRAPVPLYINILETDVLLPMTNHAFRSTASEKTR
jgi:hypothetical protein